MIIEPATIIDAPAILALWIELAGYHAELDPCFELSADAPGKYSRFLKDLISSKEAIVLVARGEPGKRPDGYAAARVTYDPPVFARMPRGELIDVYVRPALRRRGAGGAMLEGLKEWFAGRGISRLEVRVYAGNPVGRSFWRKHGFADYLDTLSLELEGPKDAP